MLCSHSKEADHGPRAIPEGYHSVTPYLIVDGAEEAIRFYERAFGATEMLRLAMPAPNDAAGGEGAARSLMPR